MLQKEVIRHMSRAYVKEKIIWNAQNLVFYSNINYSCSITENRQMS